MSGYFQVELELEGRMESERITWVQFGDVPAYGLASSGTDSLRVWVQGHPSAGPVAVSFGDGVERHLLSDTFVYDTPEFENLRSMHAVGASLTQGTQRGLPTQGSVLMGPAAQLARQLGLYFPLPMLIADGFQEMTPDLIGPPPYCQPPPLDAYQTEAALDLIPLLVDPETDDFSFRMVRVAPTLDAHNLAVGGSRVGEFMDGPTEGDIPLEFLSHMVYEPDAAIGDPIEESQMERVARVQPELIVSFDLLGNDLIDGMIDNADFSLTGMTESETFLMDIDRAVEALAATGAQVFVANLPNPVDLPFFRAKRERLKAEGLTENADLVFAAITAGVSAGNARLEARAAEHEGVYVVDIATVMQRWLSEGVQVGDATLRVAQYGGLIGLDGLHFTDTAYALVANVMLERINAVVGSDIAPIDVAAVWSQDRERPERLLEEGLDASACQSEY